jgi:hypothetical protein
MQALAATGCMSYKRPAQAQLEDKPAAVANTAAAGCVSCGEVSQQCCVQQQQQLQALQQ